MFTIVNIFFSLNITFCQQKTVEKKIPWILNGINRTISRRMGKRESFNYFKKNTINNVI